MNDSVTVDLAADPRVQGALKRVQLLIPEAEAGQILRAALLHFGEAVPDHEIRIYVSEQQDLSAD